MNKKIIALLPESIGGRLTMTSLFVGFELCGYELKILDVLKNAHEEIKKINTDAYDFLVSYDFTGIRFKTDFRLKIKTINYFSDVIESSCSGAYWAEYYEKLKDKDNFIFYWDKVLTQNALKERKIANLSYLPHAVDTNLYKNLNLEPEYDVMFAGRLTYGIRSERFLNILKSLPNVKFALYCFEKHLNQVCEKLSQHDAELLKPIYKGFIDTEEKMSEAINKSKIVINFTSQGESSLNYRVFQTLACEKLLLTDYQSEIEELFSPGKDILYYKNDEELIALIKNYIKTPQDYKKLIESGRKTVVQKYSSKMAVEKIIKICKF